MASTFVMGVPGNDAAGGSILALPSSEPSSRFVFPGLMAAVQRLPTDTIGNFVLTLTNLVVGSAIQIETQAGALIENRAAARTSEVFSVSAYASGNPNNNLRIKVRKGSSAPFYQPFETLATAVVGSQSIYIAQVADE